MKNMSCGVFHGREDFIKVKNIHWKGDGVSCVEVVAGDVL
jgi:hypothetical protein